MGGDDFSIEKWGVLASTLPMKSHVAASLLITSAGLIAPLSTAEETPTVNVGDFEIIPMGDLGNFSSWDIHPKALVGTGYDSNIFGEENNTDSDLFLRGIAGITTRWNSQQTAEVTANAEYETKQFLDSKYDGADFNGGTLELHYENEGLLNTISAHIGWQRADDPTISTGETFGHVNPYGECWLSPRGAERYLQHQRHGPGHRLP